MEIVVVGFVSDYLALGKTRLLLRLNIDRYWSAAIGLVAMADIILSLAISFGIIVLFGLVVTLPSSMNMATQTFTMANMINIWVPLLLSTLFTSIWTILILISITAIKVLAPSHRFITWFFDVDKHPVQAIGIVAGTLVIVPSLIWSLMWAVI